MLSLANLFVGRAAHLVLSLAVVAGIGARFVALNREHARLAKQRFAEDFRRVREQSAPLAMRLVDETSPGSSGPVRRVRTVRLPLPRRLLDLNEAESPSLDAVNQFVDQLASLSIESWLDIGRKVMNGQPPMGDRSSAWSVLTSTIASNELGVAAWFVRDAIDACAFFAGDSDAESSASTLRLLAARRARRRRRRWHCWPSVTWRCTNTSCSLVPSATS